MRRHAAFLLSLLVAVAPALAAQSGELKQLDAEALKGWKTIRTTALSHDGQWFAYVVSPNEGNAEVVVRPTAEGEERRFPMGELPTGSVAAALQLSGDGRWLAFLSYPTAEETRRLRTSRRPIQAKAVVVEVATGATREFEKVRRIAFGGDRPRWLAMQGYGPDAGQSGQGGQGGPGAQGGNAVGTGTDLLLHELGTATVVNIGNVAEFAFDDAGEHLAWTIDARDRLGNGIHVRNLRSDVTRVLESE